MSERLEHTESEEAPEEFTGVHDVEPEWVTGEHYSYMKIDAGSMGDNFYYSLPTFTILAKDQEELDAINDDFSALLSKYTDQIIMGSPHEASLILSLNQAAADLASYNDAVNTLRDKIRELTGSYDAAGDWESEK